VTHMAVDPFGNKFLAFPSIPLWNEDESWLTTHNNTQSNVAISEDDKNVYIEAALPGLDPKDVDITFEKGYVWIKGEAKEEETDKKKKFYRRATKSFSYRIAVPGDIDMNAEPTASYKHGVMTVTFAKSPKTQPKKIQIKTA